MSRSLLFIIAALQFGVATAEEPTPVTPPPATTTETTTAGLAPDKMANNWVSALLKNNLSDIFQLFTPADQIRIEKEWQSITSQSDPIADLQFDAILQLAKQPNGAELLTAMAVPFLEKIDPKVMSKQLEEFAGFLAMAANTQQPGVTPALDYAGLHQWLKDVAAYLATSGFNDPQKLSQAAGHVVDAIRNSTLTNSAEIRKMSVMLLTQKLTPAIGDIKKALAVYDINIDALLDSFAFTLSDVTPNSATLSIKFTAFEKPRGFPLKLITKNGSWQLTDGADNPIAALSQLVMMSLIMNGMGTGTPAQPPVIDDGAL